MAVRNGNGRHETDSSQMRVLGRLQLRHKDTNKILLIPTPSTDPNDPLNWYADLRVLCYEQ